MNEIQSKILPANDGRTIAHPDWLKIPGLIHGTTTRAALPEPGKKDFFEVVTRLRDVDILPRRLVLGGDQVHGDEVAVVQLPIAFGSHPPGFRWNAKEEAGEFAATDALVTSIAGVTLTIRTADCFPVLLLDRAERIVGAAHCGWKGTLAGLAAKTAREMIKLGADPARLEAWIGPGICMKNYEVGADLASQFRAAFPGAEASLDGVRLDLAAAIRWQLEAAGLAPQNIFQAGECTIDRSDRYFSYRGEGPETGRMITFIGFAPEETLP